MTQSTEVVENLKVAIVVDTQDDTSNLSKYNVKQLFKTTYRGKSEDDIFAGCYTSDTTIQFVGFISLCTLFTTIFIGADSGDFSYVIPAAIFCFVSGIFVCYAFSYREKLTEFPDDALHSIVEIQGEPACSHFEPFVKYHRDLCISKAVANDVDLPSWVGRYTIADAAIHYASPQAFRICIKYGLPIYSSYMFFAIEIPLAIGAHATEVAVKSTFVHNRLEIIKYLLAYDESLLNASVHDGRTPLIAASGELVGEWVDFFLKMGASPNVVDDYGYSPLALVLKNTTESQNARIDEVKVIVDGLLAHGANPSDRIQPFKNVATHKDGPTALEYVKSVPSLRFLVPCFGRGKTGNAVFLSHYKRETGSVARLLKTFLQDKDTITVAGKVFLDSDSLDSISMIESQVLESQVLVVLLSKNYLDRPYCLIELCTAWKNGIPIVPVMATGSGNDFSHEDDSEVSGEIAAAVENLSSYTRKDVDSAVKELLNTIAVKFEPNSNDATLSTQTDIIVSKVARYLK